MNTVTLRIPALSESDGATLRAGLLELDGVEAVEMEYDPGRATVTYDEEHLSPVELIDSVREMGHQVTETR